MTTRDLVDVNVTRRIISTVVGRPGHWTIDKDFALPGVPRIGDDIEIAEGWSAYQVERVTWCHGGAIEVSLEPCRTDSPERLDEIKELVDDYGWRKSGGPW